MKVMVNVIVIFPHMYKTYMSYIIIYFSVTTDICIWFMRIKFIHSFIQTKLFSDIRAKVCKQEPLTEVYVPTDECTDGQLVTSSKALNQGNVAL